METLKAKIEDGKIVFLNPLKQKQEVALLEGKIVNVEIKKAVKSRTEKQNRALHLYYTHLSKELNDHGLDIKKTLSQDMEHPWTPILIKELIWRPIQKAYLNKESTKRLATDDIDKIFDIINKFIGEQFGLHIDFPSIETLING